MEGWGTEAETIHLSQREPRLKSRLVCDTREEAGSHTGQDVNLSQLAGHFVSNLVFADLLSVRGGRALINLEAIWSTFIRHLHIKKKCPTSCN